MPGGSGAHGPHRTAVGSQAAHRPGCRLRTPGAATWGGGVRRARRTNLILNPCPAVCPGLCREPSVRRPGHDQPACTSSARGIPTEVVLDEGDGRPARCVVSLDNLGEAWKAMLTGHLTTLGPDRMREVCQALSAAVGCGP